MNQNQEESTRLPTTYEEIVSEISSFAGLPRVEAAHRVWKEALEPGWNVIRDVSGFRVTPFHYDEQMARLYKDGDGFIFESLVYWAKPARQLWIQHAFDRIEHYAKRTGTTADKLRILMYGDGPGNDSLFLASRGITVDCHEVPGAEHSTSP